MIGIFRGSAIVLRHQAERYKWIEELYDLSETYILSEEKLRDERFASESYLKYIGNMSPIQIVTLDKDNIEKFLTQDMKKFDIIMDQGEHYPLTMLVNKFAKKHGVITLDVHQGNDYYDGYFNQTLKKKIIGYIDLFLRLRFQGLRALFYVLIKYDLKLFLFFLKNYTRAGYRFFPSLPDEYKFDQCYVQGNKYKTYYKMMGYKDDEVTIIGDSELTNLAKYQGELYSSDKPYIIYVDSQLVLTFDFHKEVSQLAKFLEKEGYDFFYYPHPNSSNDFLSLLSEEVNVIPIRSINKYLRNVHFIFVHNSNMLHTIMYLSKRFAFLYGPKMVGDIYLERQTQVSLDLGIPNLDIREKEQILGVIKEFHFDPQKYENFLFENCGGKAIYTRGTDSILIESVRELLSKKNK
jgi:hypothetical protein